MGKFQFYHINEHYISYLHSIDTRVQYNKVCCNFEKLERKSKKYDPNYVPSKKKIRATVPSK